MKKIIACAISITLLTLSGNYAVKKAGETVKAKDYEECTKTSSENKYAAQNDVKSKILTILYEKNPKCNPLADEIRIARICGISNEEDNIWVDYFIKSGAESSKSYDGYYYELRHEKISIYDLTDDEEVITWYRNNL